MSSSSASSVAVVTGASGFIASVLIDHLLRKGYTVHGTVRSLSDSSKLQGFLDFFSSAVSSKQLQLFEADLGVTGSFAAAIKGANMVFHTASPFFLAKATDPQKELVEPAVNGTANVLNSAFAEPTVRKIVVTSSMAAVRRAVPAGEKLVFSEKDWNTSATIDNAPYPFSKTQAERKAWELFEAHKKAGGKATLVVVNPAWVLGPPNNVRAARDSESLKNIASFFDGSLAARGAPHLRFNAVDVRDVADIHIAAAENPNANGRYFACHPESLTPLDWAEELGKLYPHDKEKFPNKFADGPTPGVFEADTSKTLKDLGIKLIPFQQTLKDTVEQLKKFGLIKS